MKILENAKRDGFDAPVLPMALTNLWRSYSSRVEEGNAMSRPFRRTVFSRVGMNVGVALTVGEIQPDALRGRAAALLRCCVLYICCQKKEYPFTSTCHKDFLMQEIIHRRSLLFRGLAIAGLAMHPSLALHASSTITVENITRLYSVRVAKIEVPISTEEVGRIVKSWPGQIAVGGGRYSMGGQIAIEGGLHIDMRKMDRLVWLKPETQLVRVQAGMRWRELQDHLDPLGFSVQTMQSYSNFTVGGSVSVNAHGRYLGHGPIGHSVRALQLVLASGEVMEVSRRQNTDFFRAAIGGYGAIGVITEVELSVDSNSAIERSVAQVKVKDYPGYFERKIKRDAKCLLHNADLLPPMFDTATAVNWLLTDKALTVSERLIPRGKSYGLEKNIIWALTELPTGNELQRKVVRPALLAKSAVVRRNYEASLDVASLEPRSRVSSTYVLQEYFVPVRHFAEFVDEMAKIIRRYKPQILNVSIRHSPRDQDSVMAWAREEVFSFVVYYKQGTLASQLDTVGVWTRELIAAALKYAGTYYLPYQRHATREQFDAAYPQKESFKGIKAKADPYGKMSNELWAQYL